MTRPDSLNMPEHSIAQWNDDFPHFLLIPVDGCLAPPMWHSKVEPAFREKCTLMCGDDDPRVKDADRLRIGVPYVAFNSQLTGRCPRGKATLDSDRQHPKWHRQYSTKPILPSEKEIVQAFEGLGDAAVA